MDDTADEMLTIAPRFFSTIPGKNARSVRCIDLTLRSKEKSQSDSLQSKTVPGCTKPAQLTRMSGGPNASTTSCASASTAAVEQTSSFSRRAQARSASFAASRSVAITCAPSAPNASQMARPIPCPAAVTNAILLLSRWVMAPSMIVAGHAGCLGEALICYRRLEHHAVGQLVHHGALDFLPRRLASRELESAFLLQGQSPLGQIGVRNQNICSALVEVDADAVAGAQQRKAAVRGRLGRGVEDRGQTRGAGLTAVTDAGQ